MGSCLTTTKLWLWPQLRCTGDWNELLYTLGGRRLESEPRVVEPAAATACASLEICPRQTQTDQSAIFSLRLVSKRNRVTWFETAIFNIKKPINRKHYVHVSCGSQMMLHFLFLSLSTLVMLNCVFIWLITHNVCNLKDLAPAFALLCHLSRLFHIEFCWLNSNIYVNTSTFVSSECFIWNQLF